MEAGQVFQTLTGAVDVVGRRMYTVSQTWNRDVPGQDARSTTSRMEGELLFLNAQDAQNARLTFTAARREHFWYDFDISAAEVACDKTNILNKFSLDVTPSQQWQAERLGLGTDDDHLLICIEFKDKDARDEAYATLDAMRSRAGRAPLSQMPSPRAGALACPCVSVP